MSGALLERTGRKARQRKQENGKSATFPIVSEAQDGVKP
jgi:hypothetical protein